MKKLFTHEEITEIIKKERLISRIETEIKVKKVIEQLNNDDRITSPTLLIQVVFSVLDKSVSVLQTELQALVTKH